MAVLEAIGNIFRRASIGKPDATSDLELPVSVPIFLEEALPFRVVCRYLVELVSLSFPLKTATHSGVYNPSRIRARLEDSAPRFINLILVKENLAPERVMHDFVDMTEEEIES